MREFLAAPRRVTVS